MLPYAVYDDSGDERMIGIAQPIGEFDAAALMVRDLRGLSCPRCHYLDKSAGHFIAELMDVAPNAEMIILRFILVDNSERLGNRVRFRLKERFQCRFQLSELLGWIVRLLGFGLLDFLLERFL